jgi:hypothetical protein
MKVLEKINIKLIEKKQEIENLENNISELKEKYPEISAYELATRSNSNEYIEKIREINQKEMLLKTRKSEYKNLRHEKINIENENKKNGNNEFVNNINKIISKHGILKWKDLATLICALSTLEKCKFLTEEDRNNIKLKIDNRIAENNELINQISIRVNEPRVSAVNKFNMKSKITSIVAKGKESTINEMKSQFEASTQKVIGNAQDIYHKFCNSKLKEIQDQLDCVISNINDNIEKINKKNNNENESLNQQLFDLEKRFEIQEEKKKLIDKRNIEEIKEMYQQLIQLGSQEKEELQNMYI